MAAGTNYYLYSVFGQAAIKHFLPIFSEHKQDCLSSFELQINYIKNNNYNINIISYLFNLFNWLLLSNFRDDSKILNIDLALLHFILLNDTEFVNFQSLGDFKIWFLCVDIE